MGQYWTQPFDLVVDDEDPIAIWRQLGQFEPFGRQFDAPRFLVRGRLATVRRLGPEGQHVALTLVDHPVRAIAFGMGMGARNWLPGDPVRFIARLETNWYRDQAEPQWRIEWVQGPFPHRMMRPRPGVPDNISGRTLWVVDSDRQLRKEAQARQALAFWHALPLGDLRWIVETARRRHTVEVVVSQWRPWPELLDWADQVIWLCEPRNQRKWAEAGALVKPEGQAYIQIGSGDAAAKSRRLYLDRERLGSVWRRWQAGRPGLVPGGAVLAELELLGQSGATERRSLTNSYLYQRALDEQEQDRNPWTADFELGEDDRHGLEGLG
jgi:hypothetical protein